MLTKCDITKDTPHKDTELRSNSVAATRVCSGSSRYRSARSR